MTFPELLKKAGWEPGDRYDPNDPTVPIRAKNSRLMLLTSGKWSEELVHRIGHLSPYSVRFNIKHKVK